MIAKLSDDLAKALEQAGDQPLRVENPRNHKRYVIVPEDRFPNPHDETPSIPGGEWTETKNSRRFYLIGKNSARTITPDERSELQWLQQEVDDYLDRVAPLPIAETEVLLEQLRKSVQKSP